jgi:hypothetical protein
MTRRRMLLAALFALLSLAGASLLLFPACGPSSAPPVPQPAETAPPRPAPPPEQPGSGGGGTGFGRGGRAGQPPTPIVDRFAEVDAALGELVQGRIAFNTPERMSYGESRPVGLVASPAMDAGALSKELRDRIGGADAVEVATLQIGPLMEARLEGAPAFEVKELTPVQQPVSGSSPTEWRWTVRAAETGRHQLHLTINAIITVAGERYPRSLDVLNRDIEVDISAGRRIGMFVGANWQWLLGTVFIPLALWLWNQKHKKKRKRHS